ncbi:MAG: FAD-binding oxidoreductase, partial [Alphaproteobacteria bacterium]
MSSQKIIHYDFCVQDNKKLSEDFYLLSFDVGESLDSNNIQPGNFLMLSFPEREDLFLPRPFSIFDVTSNSVSVLYKIVGKGTKYLSGLTAGAKISCTLPLGNSFEKPRIDEFAFLVGGGFGVAPLNFYHRRHENFAENIK